MRKGIKAKTAMPREGNFFPKVGPWYHMPILQRLSRKVFPVSFSFRESFFLLGLGVGLVLWVSPPVGAIVQNPSEVQIQEAMEKGQEGARNKKPPTQLYYRFGSLEDDIRPHGFLMTRLSGIAALSGHFFLRGEQPSSQDIQRILQEEALQVVVIIFGNSPIFAKDSYLILKQQNGLIKPDRILFDARASLIKNDRGTPLYRAKVVASFPYGTFDPEIPTIIHVFPGTGGKITFDLDFSAIP